MILQFTENATSTAIGTVVSVAITLIMAAFILAMVLQWPHHPGNDETPAIFKITKVRHTNEYGNLNYESYVVVINSGTEAYDNRKLYAKIYRNGELLPSIIPSINCQEFIDHHPNGIKTIGGPGTTNFEWGPGAMIAIDFSQRTFMPGDRVCFEVYNKDTGRIISRDTYPHTEETNQQKMMKLFLSRQGA
ncbi:MAG: hypothetical protein WC391_09580 [Methanoregula sp.]